MSLAMHRRSPPQRSSSDLSRSPVRYHPSPRRISPRGDRHRSPPRLRSPVRSSYSQRTRSPARENLPHRARSPRRGRSRSPGKEKVTNRARSPRQGSPLKRVRSISPQKEKIPGRAKSPGHVQPRLAIKQKSSEHARSPKQLRSSSPVRIGASHSPSPRTKRLRQAQVEREVEKSLCADEEKSSSREDRRRHRERGDDKDVPNERRSMHQKSDGGTSRSLRHARDRSISPAEPRHRSRHSSQSPPQATKALARDEATRPRGAEQHRDVDQDSIVKMKVAEEALEEKQKQKPSFELSGKLAEETNRFRGVTLLFTEPSDARKPDVRWRLYVFKAGEVLNEPLYVHRQSSYLFGRERRVADIPTDHPSCSKQHAVLLFRLVEKEQSDGLLSKQSRICSFAREFCQISRDFVMHGYLRLQYCFVEPQSAWISHSTVMDGLHFVEVQLSCAANFWPMKVGSELLMHIFGISSPSYALLSGIASNQTVLLTRPTKINIFQVTICC